MANNNAKKYAKSNAQRLLLFRQVTLVCVGLHLLCVFLNYLFYFDWETRSFVGSLFWDLSALSFWGVQEYLALSALAAQGAPTLDEEGNISECIDLQDPAQLGIYSYAQDLLWVCWAVQVLTRLSSWFILFYIPVPLMALSKGWSMVVAPMLNARAAAGRRAQPEEDEDDAAGNLDPRSRLKNRRAELRAGKSAAKRR